MAYYRRRAGARRYGRRRRTPTYWVRNGVGSTTQNDNQTIWVIDCLAPLHYPNTDVYRVASPGQASMPSGLGSLIKGVHVQFHYQFHAVGSEGVVDVLPELRWNDQLYWGLAVLPWDAAADNAVIAANVTDPNQHPQLFDPVGAANTTDWMGWGKLTWSEPGSIVTQGSTQINGQGTATQSSLTTVNRLVKSRRSIKEFGESLVLCIRYNGDGAGAEHIGVVTSTLLTRRQ